MGERGRATGDESANPDIEKSRRDAERLEEHSRPSDDPQGMNPSKSQQSRRPDHEPDEHPGSGTPG